MSLRVPAAATAARCCHYVDGDLGLVDRSAGVKADVNDPAVRDAWHAMLTYIASERDYKPGWVAHKYKEKFGTWPPWGAAGADPPTPKFDPGCARA